jgi:phosphoserine phosphatase RsbU/P
MGVEESKQLKILTVDDDLLIIKLVGNVLRKAKYKIENASNGMQALAILEADPHYDLVLLDVDMPEMNGFDTCKAMRMTEHLKEIPVIFLTSLTDNKNLITGFEVGAHDYLTKPFNVEELLARVETHIQLKYKTDEIRKMNLLLEQKNHDITDSILYASYIQQAILPSRDILDEKVPDNFILYKPKDIVSGDFYWFKQIKNLLYIAAADCTGHGVPGAFMSILGILMLNEKVSRRRITPPNYVLTELRKKIKNTLHQYGQSQSNDSIDMAFCLINYDNDTLYYAGANFPLYLIRNNGTPDKVEFIVKKADKMPVGKHPNDNKSFTNHRIKLQHGDRLYIFSDGYFSQFGGKKNKKFKVRRFQELLLSIQDKAMPEQQEILDQTIEEWRGINEQVDDIMVIGIQISLDK